ncbi:MAG: hypothetical protein HYR95_01645 [Candidatus Colwellbacteria bacterium]|nr:hypothetical protein [Candidatus Colwellbacteria bacterium]
MFDKFTSRQIFIILLTTLYAFFLGWFLLLYLNGWTDTRWNYLSGTYNIISFAGAFYGLFFVARHWGGWKSDIGRAVILLSSGLLVWSIGLAIYLFYNLALQVDVPYPSWADAGFLSAYPFWAIGAVLLSKATGAQFGLRKLGGKTMLLLAPITATAASYYLLVIVARDGIITTAESSETLKLFLDFAYPISDLIIVILATLIYGLSYRYFGGKYKLPIYLILSAFAVNYFGDFSFSYGTTVETYYTGNFADALFTTTMYLLSVGIALLDSRSVPLSTESFNEGQKYQLASRIIHEQATIIGPAAWSEAQQVEGLSIDVSRMEAYVTGNRKEVLERLVLQYEQLFGKASREVCREAVRPFLSQVSIEEIPEVLR